MIHIQCRAEDARQSKGEGCAEACPTGASSNFPDETHLEHKSSPVIGFETCVAETEEFEMPSCSGS